MEEIQFKMRAIARLSDVREYLVSHIDALGEASAKEDPKYTAFHIFCQNILLLEFLATIYKSHMEILKRTPRDKMGKFIEQDTRGIFNEALKEIDKKHAA